MPFEGFGPQALPFFKALAFHQTKEWFEDNRATYESCVKGPMGDFAEDAAARLAKAKIPIKGDRKTSPFRIHRDVRFAKNKDPYKTNAGVAMTRSGSKNDPGVLYFHLSPDECFFAAGFYRLDPPLIGKLRDAAARAPRAYKQMLAKLDKRGPRAVGGGRAEAAAARLRRHRRPGDPRRRCGKGISSARATWRRRKPASRPWSTPSAPSPAMRCRCSNGAGTRSPNSR